MMANTLGRLLGAFLAMASLSNLTACASKNAQPDWSTKSASAHTAGTAGGPAHMGLRNPAAPPPRISTSMASGLHNAALDLLREASRSPSPQLRANAIEALHHAPEHIAPVVRQGLGDPNRAVRYVAAMSVGKLKLAELVPLLEPLLHDEAPSVRAAAIYGLRRNGRQVDPTPLASMVLGDDAEAKGNAVYILGELGNPTAIPLLRQSIGRGLSRTPLARRKVVELQAAEAMVKLGVPQQLDAIRAGLFARAEEGELAALAAQMAGELRDGAVLNTLLDLATRTGQRQQSAEVRMAAAVAVAKIDAEQAPIDVALEYAGSERPELRAQAAHALGVIAGAARYDALFNFAVRLMDDSNPLVQVAAAGAVLQVLRNQDLQSIEDAFGR